MKKYVSMTGEVVLLLAVFLLVSFVHNDVIVPHSGAYGKFLGKNLPIWISIMFAITAVLVAIVFQIKKRIVKERYESIIAMSSFRRLGKQDILLTSLAGLFTGLFFICMIKVSFIATHFPDFKQYIAMFMKSQSFVMVIVGLSIIGPLFEEVFFRGLLFNIMRRKLPFLAALLLQAAFYGYCQPNPSIQVVSFFLALMYGILYYRLKSIWSTLITAAVMNTFIFVAKKTGLLDQLGTTVPDPILLFISGISLFFMIVLLVAAWKEQSKTKHLLMIGNLLLWTVVYSLVYYPFIFGVWNAGVMRIGSIRHWLGHNNVIGFIPYDILAFAAYFYVMKVVHKRNLITVSNFTRISFKTGLFIAILGVLMGVWVQGVFLIPHMNEAFPQFDKLTVYLTTALLPVYLAFLVIHSIYKEIFFRAMIYNVLRSSLPVWISTLMTGIVYGGLFFNWDVLLTVYACLGALIFSLMFEWCKSIWAPIINEFFVFAAYYAIKKMHIVYGPGVVWAIALSTIGVVYLMYYIWRNRDTEQRKASAAKQANQVAIES